MCAVFGQSFTERVVSTRVCTDESDNAGPLITQRWQKVQFPMATQPASPLKGAVDSLWPYLGTRVVLKAASLWGCVSESAAEQSWRRPRWVRRPSVGRDVMVDLRRTQKSKSLLVFPLFSHLRKGKNPKTYTLHTHIPKEGRFCASRRAAKWRCNWVFF